MTTTPPVSSTSPMPELAATPSTATPPTAEPGNTTSEWRLAIGAMVTNGIALAVDFGAPLDGRQQAAIIGFVGTMTTIAGAYAIARGIRKKGTAG